MPKAPTGTTLIGATSGSTSCCSQAGAQFDQAKRAEIYREMQQILRDEGGVVIWAYANYVYAMGDKVQHGPDVAANWELDGGRYVERWWFA